jgi:membrane-bound metal-dependent hydrolase YbcI (DUF457 family)
MLDMLYDTHKRYGQVAGIAMMPVAASLGVLELDLGMVNGVESSLMNIGALLFYGVVALMASMFGAEFPDLDSPGSKPAQKHKILAFLFRTLGVKHRGKFSHDFVSQTILWGLIYTGLLFVEVSLATTSVELFVLSLAKVYVFFTFVGVLSHLFADAMTVDGVWFLWVFKIRFMPVFIRKVGIGSFRPFKTWFTTGSAWNDINYKFMTLLIPFVAIFTVIKLVDLI